MSTPRVHTVLRPPRQSLAGHMGCSIFFHFAAGAGFFFMSLCTGQCTPPGPLIDPDQAIEVSMVVLPRSETKMPDRAARAPSEVGEVLAPPDPEPPPVKESDLVVHTPDVKPKPGNADDANRKKLLEQLRRKELLAMMAPDGAVDRNATDPDSLSDEQINLLGAGAMGDPEYARYIQKVQQIFMQGFHPLQAIRENNPGLVTRVLVHVDPASGRITSWEITGSSGNPAFDAAAERAVQGVGELPLPPERFRPLMAQGYGVNFK